MIEHQSANNKLCFLPKAKLFSFMADLNKTILVAFIMRLVRHMRKTKVNRETTMYCYWDASNLFETPCI